MQHDELEYVGFWPRVGASIIDSILLLIIIGPILTVFYGDSYWTGDNFIKGPMDFLLAWLFPIVATILLWVVKQATPGKMAVDAKIVDAKTGKSASTGQLIGRYFAYFISILPLGFGFFWIAFDERKQGWHDKITGTVVIRKKKNREPKTVTFNS